MPSIITPMQRAQTNERCTCGYSGPQWDGVGRCAHCGGRLITPPTRIGASQRQPLAPISLARMDVLVSSGHAVRLTDARDVQVGDVVFGHGTTGPSYVSQQGNTMCESEYVAERVTRTYVHRIQLQTIGTMTSCRSGGPWPPLRRVLSEDEVYVVDVSVSDPPLALMRACRDLLSGLTSLVSIDPTDDVIFRPSSGSHGPIAADRLRSAGYVLTYVSTGPARRCYVVTSPVGRFSGRFSDLPSSGSSAPFLPDPPFVAGPLLPTGVLLSSDADMSLCQCVCGAVSLASWVDMVGVECAFSHRPRCAALASILEGDRSSFDVITARFLGTYITLSRMMWSALLDDLKPGSDSHDRVSYIVSNYDADRVIS